MNDDLNESENNAFSKEITVSKIVNAKTDLCFDPQLCVLSTEIEYTKTPLIKNCDDNIVCITQSANIIIKLKYR